MERAEEKVNGERCTGRQASEHGQKSTRAAKTIVTGCDGGIVCSRNGGKDWELFLVRSEFALPPQRPAVVMATYPEHYS